MRSRAAELVRNMAAASSNGPAGPSQSDAGRSRFFGRRAAMKSPSEALRPEAAPPPPAPPPRKKRRFSALSALSSLMTLAMILIFVGAYLFSAGERRLRAPGPLAADKVVVIAPKSDVPEIIGKLESEGVIDDPWLMQGVLLAEGSRSKLKAGEYLFKQNASLREVIDILVGGRSILHSFTVPEGWTSEQIVGRLREQELLENDIKEIPQEGTLLPETYKFARGEARDKQIQKMAEAQKKVLAEVWAKRAPDLPLRSPYELVTLASIVEKETGRADERPRVAGVFVNRLVKGMRLQSDPTIVYGLVGGKGSLGRPITRADLNKTPNRFNTYQISGLPPGPIANPGRAAMEAVANPMRTSELYFVADGTGGHVFAETLDQHNRNVLRWRQIEQDAKDKLAPDADKPVNPGAKPPDQHGELERAPNVGEAALAFAATDSGSAAATAALAAALASGEKVTPRAPESAPPPPVDRAQDEAEDRAAGQKAAAMKLFSLGPGLEELGIKIRGVNDEQEFLEGFDGGGLDGPGPASGEAFPVSPGRLADLRARAAKYGLSVIPGHLPASAPRLSVPPLSTGDQALAGQQARARGFDASEGTDFDPLKNQSFDLNSPQSIPKPVAPGPLDRASLGAGRGLGPGAIEKPVRPRIFDASEGTALDPLRDRSFDLNSSKSLPALVARGRSKILSPSTRQPRGWPSSI